MEELLFEKPMQYQVRRDGDAYYLDVLCGGVAMFEVRVALTADEIAAFRRDPEALENLASQTAKLRRPPR